MRKTRTEKVHDILYGNEKDRYDKIQSLVISKITDATLDEAIDVAERKNKKTISVSELSEKAQNDFTKCFNEAEEQLN